MVELTAEEYEDFCDMRGLHLQRMKTHAISFKMEGKDFHDPANKPELDRHKVEATKCRTEIDKIIARKGFK